MFSCSEVPAGASCTCGSFFSHLGWNQSFECQLHHRSHRDLREGSCSALLLAALCTSCGGGFSTPTDPGKGPPGGTPAGTYTIVVTGTSGNVSHATSTQLTMN